MKLHQATAFFLATLLSCTAHAAGPAPAYKVTILHPLAGYTHSFGNDISGTWQVGDGYGPATGGRLHAFLWNSTAESLVDLTPPGFTHAVAQAIDGNTQVGNTIGPAGGDNNHATLSRGTATSYVDLHPAGYRWSTANGVRGNAQVGSAAPNDSFDSHAMLWFSSPTRTIDLHPSGFRQSVANDVEGDIQVGYGIVDGNEGFHHALMWRSSAASVVDLHPAGFSHSLIHRISGNSQIGYVQPNLNGGPTHAMLWHGTSESAVDLNPAGFLRSVALGLDGDRQVGWAQLNDNSENRALLWNGSAESAFDLHRYVAGLPVTITDTFAHNIDPNGMIIGSGWDVERRRYALLWTPIPEPSTALLFVVGFALVRFAAYAVARREDARCAGQGANFKRLSLFRASTIPHPSRATCVAGNVARYSRLPRIYELEAKEYGDVTHAPRENHDHRGRQRRRHHRSLVRRRRAGKHRLARHPANR